MKTRRRASVAAAVIVASIAAAACGEQVASHVSAGDTVHSAFTSVFKSNTTQFVVTAQNLPGQAALLDGSFSIVLTTSQAAGGSATAGERRSVDVSIYHESTNLVDLRETGGSVYLRTDVEDLAGLAGPGQSDSIAAELNQFANRPGLGWVHEVIAGKWVGLSKSTLLAFVHQVAGMSDMGKSALNLQQTKQLRIAVSTSLVQSIREWLSIHQTSSDEYAMNLPIRDFVGSLLQGLYKPLASYLKVAVPSQAELGKVIDKIPSSLSVHANMWVADGSLSKLQIFVPNSAASILIAVSHPTAPVVAPTGATMLTVANLSDLLATVTSGAASRSQASAVLGSL